MREAQVSAYGLRGSLQGFAEQVTEFVVGKVRFQALSPTGATRRARS